MKLSYLKKLSLSILGIAVLGSLLFGFLVYEMVSVSQRGHIASLSAVSRQSVNAASNRSNPAATLGIAVNIPSSLPGMPWVKLGYPTCGLGNQSGSSLKNTIQGYHNQGTRVLLIYCQPRPSQLFNTNLLDDAAQGRADAVQCGNEQMKYDPTFTNYVPPNRFARFFDLCQSAMLAVSPAIPIILGALDPHVTPYDNNLLLGQVHYLDQMQTAMNTQVHPGSHWTWRSQILGLINSWHDGFPGPNVNNLLGLFSFWASEFHINLSNGDLGKHLWVVEDTGCFKGCGVDANNKAQVAIAHITSLVIDVKTTIQFRVPFFFFSARDFLSRGVYWPIGVLALNGNLKPLRQDLPMGSRTLTLRCPSGRITVIDQLKLLTSLYNGCTLQEGWYDTLTRK